MMPGTLTRTRPRPNFVSGRVRPCSTAAMSIKEDDADLVSHSIVDDGINLGLDQGSPAVPINRSSSSSPLVQVESSEVLLEGQTKLSSYMDPRSQLEMDKRAIYDHPLFPLLAILLEKCELATKSGESQPSVSLNDEVRIFLQRLEHEKVALEGKDKETNELMMLALQVLRIHLLELEKVQDLSKDFCSRYICALKGKMLTENLVRNDLGGYDSDDSGSGYGGGPNLVSPRPLSAAPVASGIPPSMAHLQYSPVGAPEIGGSANGTFLMGSGQGWMMDPLHQHQHQQQQQQLQQLQHLRQHSVSDSSDLMLGAAMSWEMLCKSTLSGVDADEAGYDLFADSGPRSSEKCVSKLSSLPSHYANQHLVHHQGPIL